jgi:hypothetical protein
MIEDRYLVDKYLAEGAFGHIFSAVDTKTKSKEESYYEVVIKL